MFVLTVMICVDVVACTRENAGYASIGIPAAGRLPSASRSAASSPRTVRRAPASS